MLPTLPYLSIQTTLFSWTPKCSPFSLSHLSSFCSSAFCSLPPMLSQLPHVPCLPVQHPLCACLLLPFCLPTLCLHRTRLFSAFFSQTQLFPFPPYSSVTQANHCGVLSLPFRGACLPTAPLIHTLPGAQIHACCCMSGARTFWHYLYHHLLLSLPFPPACFTQDGEGRLGDGTDPSHTHVCVLLSLIQWTRKKYSFLISLLFIIISIIIILLKPFYYYYYYIHSLLFLWLFHILLCYCVVVKQCDSSVLCVSLLFVTAFWHCYTHFAFLRRATWSSTFLPLFQSTARLPTHHTFTTLPVLSSLEIDIIISLTSMNGTDLPPSLLLLPLLIWDYWTCGMVSFPF